MKACPTLQEDFQFQLSVKNGENRFELDLSKPIHVFHDTDAKQKVYAINVSMTGAAMVLIGEVVVEEASLKIHPHNTAWA